MKHRIEITETLIKRDSDGALFIRYTPKLSPICLAFGTLTFAPWDREVGATHAEHEAAKRAARESAIKSIHAIAADFAL